MTLGLYPNVFSTRVKLRRQFLTDPYAKNVSELKTVVYSVRTRTLNSTLIDIIPVTGKEKLRFVRLVNTGQTTSVYVAGANETQEISIEWSAKGL